MIDKLIEHIIRPGEFRVKWATQSAEDIPSKRDADGTLVQYFYKAYVAKRRTGLFKKLTAALKNHTMIGMDTDGFEVWRS